MRDQRASKKRSDFDELKRCFLGALIFTCQGAVCLSPSVVKKENWKVFFSRPVALSRKKILIFFSQISQVVYCVCYVVRKPPLSEQGLASQLTVGQWNAPRFFRIEPPPKTQASFLHTSFGKFQTSMVRVRLLHYTTVWLSFCMIISDCRHQN